MDSDITARLTRIEATLPTLATKAETLRAEVARWTLATVIGLLIGFLALFVTMGNLYMNPPPTEKSSERTEAPIVIVIPAEVLRQKE